MTEKEKEYRREWMVRSLTKCNLPKKCDLCATKWQIQIQIIHLIFKNFLRTYTHVRGNFYNFICISVSSVSFNPQN